jgi:hypothetical protein
MAKRGERPKGARGLGGAKAKMENLENSWERQKEPKKI